MKLDMIYPHSSEYMTELPNDSIHLAVFSPPYNTSIAYDNYNDSLDFQEYLGLMKRVLSETYRVLVHGGRMCINIANTGRNPYIPLHSYFIQIAMELGFLMRGEIIWDKTASVGGSTAWGSWLSASNPSLRDVHEYILIFSKGAYQRTPGTSTIERDDFLEWTKSIWRMQTTSAKQLKHPAPFPLELPKRLIQLYSYQDDVVLDPFLGSGTTAVAAIQNNRRFIGYEVSEGYCEIANKRIYQTQRSLLPMEIEYNAKSEGDSP